MSRLKRSHAFKTIEHGNEFHIILVHGLKDHYKPLAKACRKSMSLLRDQSTVPDLRAASLHIFSFTAEVLFRKGEPKLEDLAILLQTNLKKLCKPNSKSKSESQQRFIFIGHGLACWVIERAVAWNYDLVSSPMFDNIWGLILWGQPEKKDESEWGAFVAPYLKNARKASVSLPATWTSAIEHNLHKLETSGGIVPPEIKRIEDSKLTAPRGSTLNESLDREQADRQLKTGFSFIKRLNVLHIHVRNTRKKSSEQLFPSVDESAMNSLKQKMSEIYDRGVSQKTNPGERQDVRETPAPTQAQSINAVSRSRPEIQPITFNQNKKEALNDDILDTAASVMQPVEQPSKLQEDENYLKELQHHAQTYLSRGEYTQAWILYAQMSQLLQVQRSRQPNDSASNSMLHLDFEVKHQLAMKALREGELVVAERAFQELKEKHKTLKLAETIRWSLDHWLSVVYIELGSYKHAISLVEGILRSTKTWKSEGTSSYLDKLPEHEAQWLVSHSKALNCLARAREDEMNQVYENPEKLVIEYGKTVKENNERLNEIESILTNDIKGWKHKEQCLRFTLTVVQLRMLAGRRRAAKMLIDEEDCENYARVLGKAHPMSIERLILKTQVLLPAANKECDETFRELQDAMRSGYARLHPLTLSACELQLAIFLKQGRLTEAINSSRDLISRIADANLGQNHFRSLQARRWQARVLFERGEIVAALATSEMFTTTCRSPGSGSPKNSSVLVCVVDSILMNLRLRHYRTAENKLLHLFGEFHCSMFPGKQTLEPATKSFFSMEPDDVVRHLLGLPEDQESKTPVDQAFVASYVTALQCLYICYLERKSLSSEVLDTLDKYVVERRVHQSIDSGGDLDALTLLYNVAIIEREHKDFEKASKNLQEAKKGFINSLGHDHPHTLMVDLELRLVELLRYRHKHISKTEKPLIGIEGQISLDSEYQGNFVNSDDALNLIRMQKMVLIRLDNSLGGSHVFTLSARIDLANVLWEVGNLEETGNLELEIMWYLLPYKGTFFRKTPALPFTAREMKHQSSSQHWAGVLRDRLHREFEAILANTDGTVEPIEQRFLSALSSFAHNEHGVGHYQEAVTAQHAYVTMCKCSSTNQSMLAEARLELGYMLLELGYMHQSCADTCSDPILRNDRYMQAMKIYGDIFQTQETYGTPLHNAARSCLGAIYFQQGKFTLARDEQKKVYEALKKPLTNDTYTLLDSIYNLALTEKSLHNEISALSLCVEGKDISLEEFGVDDERTKLFDNKLKDWGVPQTRPSSAIGTQHRNQRDSVMATPPKKHVRRSEDTYG